MVGTEVSLTLNSIRLAWLRSKKEGTMTNPRRRRGWISRIRMLAIIATLSAHAQTFSILHTFEGGAEGDGNSPMGVLAQDTKGNIYGVTPNGGHSWGCDKKGCGTIYKLRGNKLTILERLNWNATPANGVLLDAAGDLYGTSSGGAFNDGTIFKRAATGKFSTFHNFKQNGGPTTGLVQDAAGNFYGGGASSISQAGLLYRVDAAGKFTILYRFKGPPNDTGGPVGSLIMDAAGNLYGTTVEGGSGTCGDPNTGCGTVFKFNVITGKETVLHNFAPPNDGYSPFAGVVMDSEGNLYGTTQSGGASGVNCTNYGNEGCGTVFKIDTTGKETILHTFTGVPSDGAVPRSELLLDAVGNLYGTTTQGGDGTAVDCSGMGCGIVFKLDTNNNETVLHDFQGEADGALPLAGLIHDGKGNLYGTAHFGGDSNCKPDSPQYAGCGVFFEITP